MGKSVAMTDQRARLGKGLTVKVAAWIFWSFVAAATAFAAEPTKDAIAARERSYYAYIENDIKQQFETAMAEFKQTPKRDTSKQTQDDAIDGHKNDVLQQSKYTCDMCWRDAKNTIENASDAGDRFHKLR